MCLTGGPRVAGSVDVRGWMSGTRTKGRTLAAAHPAVPGLSSVPCALLSAPAAAANMADQHPSAACCMAGDGASEYSGGWRDLKRQGYGVQFEVNSRCCLPTAMGMVAEAAEHAAGRLQAHERMHAAAWLAARLRAMRLAYASSDQTTWPPLVASIRCTAQRCACRAVQTSLLALGPLQRGRFKYMGQWEGDLQHGQGKCTYADGSQYDGQWQAGKRCAPCRAGWPAKAGKAAGCRMGVQASVVLPAPDLRQSGRPGCADARCMLPDPTVACLPGSQPFLLACQIGRAHV